MSEGPGSPIRTGRWPFPPGNGHPLCPLRRSSDDWTRCGPGASRTMPSTCSAMLAVILAFLAPAWRQPDSIWVTPGAVYSDLTINHWPNWWLVKQSLRQHGQVPLWRPAIMGGAPLVGNPLAALFYPPNWLLVALPLAPAFHVLLALHLYGAGGRALWAGAPGGRPLALCRLYRRAELCPHPQADRPRRGRARRALAGIRLAAASASGCCTARHAAQTRRRRARRRHGALGCGMPYPGPDLPRRPTHRLLERPLPGRIRRSIAASQRLARRRRTGRAAPGAAARRSCPSPPWRSAPCKLCPPWN